MKLTFIVLLLVSLFSASFIASAKDRWVRDQGTGTIEVVINTTPSTPAPVILVNTNANTNMSVVVTTNTVVQPTNVVVYQQTNWPAKANATAGFQKPVEYKATKVVQTQEPRQKKGFFGRLFGPCPPTMIDVVSGDKLPANPVRRSYRSFTLPTMWGTYNYNHSQGTDTYAERSWDDYGPREVVHQSTYVNTSESFHPERRRWVAPTYYDNSGVQARTVTWP